MTTMHTFSIDGTDVKATMLRFQITYELNRPNFLSAVFQKRALDALITISAAQTIYVRLSDDIATGYYVFYGIVKMVEPDGLYYKVTASSCSYRLYDYVHTETYSAGSVTNGGVIDDIFQSCPIDIVPNYMTSDVSHMTDTHTFSGPYVVVNSNAIDQFHKLMWYGAKDSGDVPCIFRDSQTAANYIYIEDCGYNVPSSTITLYPTTKVPMTNNTNYIINCVHTNYRNAYHLSDDSDSGGVATHGASGSVSYHGERFFTTSLPEVDNLSDVIAHQAGLMRQYQWSYNNLGPITVPERDLHGNSTHYPVINTIYDIYDEIAGTTYADYNCIKRELYYPGFKNKLWFGKSNGTPIVYAMPPTTAGFFGSTTNKATATDSILAGFGCGFHAYQTSGQTIATGSSWVTQTYNTETFDIGGNFTHTTGIFVAPVDGLYHFDAELSVGGLTSTDRAEMRIYNTTDSVAHGFNVANPVSSWSTVYLPLSVTVPVTAGDSIVCQGRHSYASDRTTGGTRDVNWFGGYLVTHY